jgi:hypothetical protein
LLAAGVWRWQVLNRPAFAAQALLDAGNQRSQVPSSRREVEKAFKDQGVEAVAPDLNYGYLAWTQLASVQGRLTPLLYFHGGDDRARTGPHAFVYILSDRDFDLDALPRTVASENEYRYHCEVLRQSGYGYVVYYTGDDLEWLRTPPADPGLNAASGN